MGYINEENWNKFHTLYDIYTNKWLIMYKWIALCDYTISLFLLFYINNANCVKCFIEIFVQLN